MLNLHTPNLKSHLEEGHTPHHCRGVHSVGSLLPVDLGPQGSLEGLEGLKDQIFPVKTEKKEVTGNAKLERSWLLTHLRP